MRHALLLLVSMLAPLTAVASAVPSRYEFVAAHMGTLFKIVLFADDPARAQAAAKRAFERIGALDRCLSDYDAASEVLSLTRQRAHVPIAVSGDLFEVLRLSQAAADATGGAFDVTVGPLVQLWRETHRTGRMPTARRRAKAAQAVGFQKLELDTDARTVTLASSRMQLDFGGIGKGHAADIALATLTQAGFERAMVAASGDLALGAAPPDSVGWTVEIARVSGGQPFTVVATHVGISTSADREQFVEIDGVRYSHIVDPRSGMALTDPVTVTTIADTAAWSDSLATAFSVARAEGARTMLGRLTQPVRVLVQVSAARGRLPRSTMILGVNPSGVRAGPL